MEEPAPEPDDNEFIQGNKAIENKSGMSINTFKKCAGMTGVTIGKTDEPKPKNQVTMADIKRVMEFKKQF